MPKSTAGLGNFRVEVRTLTWPSRNFQQKNVPLFEFRLSLSRFPHVRLNQNILEKVQASYERMTAREHVRIHKVEIKAFPWLANITSSILATTNGKSCTCRSQENQAFLSFFAVGMSTENKSSLKRNLRKDLFERHCIQLFAMFSCFFLILRSSPPLGPVPS